MDFLNIEFFGTTLSWYATTAFIIVIAIAIAIGALLLIRKKIDQKKLREDQEIASYALNAIALFYCLLVGLVVVDVQDNHNEIQNNVVHEATLLMNLYRTSSHFPEFNGPEISKAICNYITHIQEEEWPLMRQGKDLALEPPIHTHNIWKTIAAFQPQNYRQLTLYQEFMDYQKQLTEARFKRLSSVRGTTSTFLWAILIYGGIIVVACSFMFAAKSLIEHIIQIGFKVSFIILVLLLIYTLDNPYSGPTAISKEPFQQALEQIKTMETTKGFQDPKPI